jgi:hypothetical protein
MYKHVIIIFMLSLWLQTAVAESAEPNATELVRAVRESENWLHRIDSLQFRIEGRWSRSPESIAVRRAELKKQSPDEEPDPQRNWDLKPSYRDMLEYVIDFKRERLRYVNNTPGRRYYLGIWDGRQAIQCNKRGDRDLHYVLDSTKKMFDVIFGSLSWPRAQPHSFWWDPKDIEQKMHLFGREEDFTITGRADYHGVTCYVLEYTPQHDPAQTNRWYVGTKDHLLYGRREESRAGWFYEYWTLDYKEVAPGCWIPMTQGYKFTNYDEDKKEHYISGRRDVEVLDVRINEKLADELFQMEFKEGFYVVDRRSGKTVINKHIAAPPSLIDQPLPKMTELGFNLAQGQTSGKIILVCFWDMEQRPSRNCIRKLAKRAVQLKEKGVTIVAIQASKVDEDKFNEWVKENKIPFPAEMIEGDDEKIRFAWGVRSLPWLILADKKHTVQVEGCALNELEDNLKRLTIADSTGHFIPDDIQELRETVPAIFQQIAGYHIEYKADKHPLDEQYFPQGNIENALKAEDPDSPVLASWIKGMRQSYSYDIALDVFDSCYSCRELKYALDDKQRLNLKHEGISSTDGDKNYAYWPQEKQGTIATDDADTPTRASWLAEFRDPKVTEEYQSHQLLINHSPMRIIRDRVFSGSSKDQRWLQNEILFEDFAGYKLDGADIVLPRKIVKNSHLVRGTGLDNEPTVFAEKNVLYLKDLSPPKVTKRDSFAYCFPADTEVWVKDQDYSYFARGDGKIVPLHPPSLLDKPLPELKELKIELPTADVEDKMILVCFFDVNQRPSRNCIGQLAKKATETELKEKSTTIMAVQASKVSENTLAELKKKYNIPFEIGMLTDDIEKIRFAWGVRSLPWLILTDKKHTVRAEGFGLEELTDTIKEINDVEE